MYAYFMPGPAELIIMLFMGLICLGVPIAVVIVVLAMSRKSGSSMPGSAPCPNCGTHVVPGARFCHQCGNSLQEQQGP